MGALRLLLNAKRSVKLEPWSRDDKELLAQSEVAITDIAIDTATVRLKSKLRYPILKPLCFLTSLPMLACCFRN